MTTGEILLEILKYVGPAALVLAATALVLKESRSRKETKDRYAIYRQTFAHVVPLRLQAYERAVIYLERISPENLILRVDAIGKTVRVFQIQLNAEIREEFAHNVAQQLYIKQESWADLVRAKEQIIALINQAAKELPPDAPGVELGKRIITNMVKAELAPTHQAIRSLKEDIQQMFRF